MNYGIPRPHPYVLEDRTASNVDTDFDDMYDRIFYHINRSPGQTTTRIYEMYRRASRSRGVPSNREAIAQLEFLPNESLGNVTFMRPFQVTIPMSRYLRKTALFGTSLSRKFVASDGKEYKWSYRTAGYEWLCTTIDDKYIVAHYDLKPPNVRTYDVSVMFSCCSTLKH